MFDNTPEQARYQDIEDEILERMLDAVKPTVIDAFLKAATEVLDRERERE